MKHYLRFIFALAILSITDPGFTYPLDAYPDTGIRRVEAARLAVFGKMRGRRQPPGALLPASLVDLRLLDHPDLVLPEPDPEFTARVVKLLGNKADRYGIAVLDLSDLDHPRYAEHRADYKQNVGSVGKIAVAMALFQALADVYPDDIEARKQILRETIVTADEFIQWDHHEVRLWNPDTGALSFRPLKVGDQGSLWEYLDWTLSISSNAAAAMVMKNAMLLRHFRKDYPVSNDEADRFFEKTSRPQLRELYEQTFLEPFTRNGLDLQSFRQGSFFTRYGKRRVPTGYNSYGTARELMRFILLMEQGKLVDLFSSREIKRLLYMTERRIRYASSPALYDSAVYFKSGSLYSCKEEVGFTCKKYHGNVKNYMNSVAIVETPAGVNRLHYLATLISNVLYKNSAVDHQTLATYIHRLIEADHPPAATAPGELPPEVTFGRKLIGFTAEQEERLQIAQVQTSLLQLGYNVGKVDGKLGSKTRAAIKAFQKKQQLSVNGKVSQQLLEQLKMAIENKSPADLSQPDRATQQ
ncbi:MAG: peptidoglycan-binding domain-containing protein [Desulfobacterales bacterium]|jgi:hypothetical protein